MKSRKTALGNAGFRLFYQSLRQGEQAVFNQKTACIAEAFSDKSEMKKKFADTVYQKAGATSQDCGKEKGN